MTLDRGNVRPHESGPAKWDLDAVVFDFVIESRNRFTAHQHDLQQSGKFACRLLCELVGTSSARVDQKYREPVELAQRSMHRVDFLSQTNLDRPACDNLTPPTKSYFVIEQKSFDNARPSHFVHRRRTQNTLCVATHLDPHDRTAVISEGDQLNDEGCDLRPLDRLLKATLDASYIADYERTP